MKLQTFSIRILFRGQETLMNIYINIHSLKTLTKSSNARVVFEWSSNPASGAV